MPFILSCECGATISVTAGQAGEDVRCQCGRTMRAPSLSDLRRDVGEAKDETAPQPDASLGNRRLQFTLGGLLWFTTVVAVLCAWMACAKRLWAPDWETPLLSLAFLFWPSIGGLIAWSCPGIAFARRFRMFVGVGVLAVLFFWGWFSYTTSGELGLALAIFAVLVATLLTLFILWIPQALVVFAAVVYVRERRRKRDVNQEAANQARSQGELPEG